MMKRISFIAALALLAATFLGGCSLLGQPATSGGTAAPVVTASPQVDPRLLMPKKDAEALVGNALKDPQILLSSNYLAATAAAQPSQSLAPSASAPVIATSNYTECFYETAVKGGRFLQITLLQTTPEMAKNGVSNKMQFDALLKLNPLGDSKLMVVPGVGDEAFILPPGIHIMRRGYYIVIGVGNPDDAANREILMNAGKLAVAKLDALLGPEPPATTPPATTPPAATPTAKATATAAPK
jgi:hypothetical protein